MKWKFFVDFQRRHKMNDSVFAFSQGFMKNVSEKIPLYLSKYHFSIFFFRADENAAEFCTKSCDDRVWRELTLLGIAKF